MSGAPDKDFNACCLQMLPPAAVNGQPAPRTQAAPVAPNLRRQSRLPEQTRPAMPLARASAALRRSRWFRWTPSWRAAAPLIQGICGAPPSLRKLHNAPLDEGKDAFK